MATSWSVTALATDPDVTMRNQGTNELREENLLKKFKPLERNIDTEPMVVTDKDGYILLWYLPGILGIERSVREKKNCSGGC